MTLSHCTLATTVTEMFRSSNEYHRPVSIGLYQGTKSVYDREAEYGIHFNHILLFQYVQSLDYNEIKRYFQGGHNVVLNIEFTSPTAVLRDITVGKFDQYLYSFAAQVRSGGQKLTIRTLHEANGGW